MILCSFIYPYTYRCYVFIFYIACIYLLSLCYCIFCIDHHIQISYLPFINGVDDCSFTSPPVSVTLVNREIQFSFFFLFFFCRMDEVNVGNFYPHIIQIGEIEATQVSDHTRFILTPC